MTKWQILGVLIISAFVLGIWAYGNAESDNGSANIFPVKAQSSPSALANSSWPMLGHDIQHTGEASINGSQNNITVWESKTGGWMDSSPALGSDGTIYFVGSNTFDFHNDTLYAVAPNGTLKWRSESCNITSKSAPLIGADNTIYLSGTSILYAFYPNGTSKWQYKAQDSTGMSSPVIAPDGTIYFSNSNKFYAVNSNGTLKWVTNETNVTASHFSAPALSPDGTTIYFGGGLDGNALYALNSDGSVKWSFPLEGIGQGVYSPAVDQNGTIYFTTEIYDSEGSKISYAVNFNGTQKWNFKISADQSFSSYNSPVLGSNGTVYLATNKGIVYALSSDGNLKWKYQTDSKLPIDYAMAVDSNGTLYFGSDYLYALDVNGTLKWRYQLNNNLTPNNNTLKVMAPIISSNGTLYVGSNDGGYLYAVG
jgi:outer membrane protein assembly factor BamB